MTQLETKIAQTINSAHKSAHAAADQFFKSQLGGRDQGACGFAWVNLYDYEGKPIKGNTRVGKILKALGVCQDYKRTFQMWNPSKYGCQSVDALEAGAEAAARVLREAGFTAYAGSRLD